MKLLAAIALVTPFVVACGSESVADSDFGTHEIATGVSTLALTSTLKPVATFGSNPGGLKLFEYAPTSIAAGAPLVLVLHGCTQGANDMQGLGWNELADQHGFVVGYPEQTTGNNSARCFNWGGIYGDMSTLQRDKGENASLKQMVDALVAKHHLDPKRVFIVGFSAGAGSAIVAAATWPEVFAGVASMSGLPYACPKSYADVFTCQNPGVDKTPAEWGAKVKSAFSAYNGPYPRISVWQGAADTTVGPKNRTEIVNQWTNVHGLAEAPSATATIDGAKYEAYKNGAGEVLVESYEVPGMKHGVAIAPGKQCGTAGMYAFDKGICSTSLVAGFFGLGPSGTTTPGADGGTLPDGGVASGADGGTKPAGTGGSGAAGGVGAAAVEEQDPRSPASTCSAVPGRAGTGGTGSAFGALALGLALAASRRRASRITGNNTNNDKVSR